MSEGSIRVNSGELRKIVRDILTETIDLHRSSKMVANVGEAYEPPVGEPSDEEIEDFLYCNPLLDLETVQHLTDEGLLGFFAQTARTSPQWLDEFRENVAAWAKNNAWLSGDAPLLHLDQIYGRTSETELWTPQQERTPGWIETSPSYLLLAASLLQQGKFLSEMNWRDFEKLVGEWLESEGWKVQVTRASKDGGIDVIAEKSDTVLGDVRALWQAKKYGAANKVKLREV
ncbi:MAG: hypothetical protein JWQ04_944, partial [Pedosphaera sp.]|nr:hypothetical protein [Pedosphaera sp.]